MTYSVASHPNYLIIDYLTDKKVVGARSVNLQDLTIEIYNYDTEEVETKKLAFGGVDEEKRWIIVGFAKESVI